MTLYNQIAQKAKEYENDIAEFLIKMVRVPSFSTKEKEVIQVIKTEMEKVGFDEVRIDGLGNIIGRIGSGPRIIAFDAHIDTVYPGDESLWNFPPFDAHIKEGKVWGRGTVDQEGGMASMVYAAKIIKALDLNKEFTIYFTGTVMEEDCDGLCWQYLIKEEKLKPEMVVITEPSNMKIARGHRGRMEMTVEVKGLSCHGSAPERGDNAIYKISRIALEIEKLNEQLKDDSFLGKGTIAVTQVFFSSPSQCAVPDSASLYLDKRLTQGETKESAVKQVKDAVKRAGYPDAEVTIPVYEGKAYTGNSYSTEKYFPTWVVEEDSPWIQEAIKAYEKVLNKKPVVDKWTFSTNGVAIMGKFKIPCIGMGPGNEIYAHAPNEATPIEQLTQATAFYAALVAQLNKLD